MENILDTKVPNIGVDLLKPTKYIPSQPETVNERMTSWYDWLVSHVPKIIRKRTIVAYRIMQNKVMSLFKQQEDFTVKERKRLLNKVIAHYYIESRNEVTSPTDFLNNVRKVMIAFLNENRQNKVQLRLICTMIRIDAATGKVTNEEQASFNSKQKSVFESTDLEAVYVRMIGKMLESFTSYLKNGSGWVLKKVLRVDITLNKLKPLRGSSYMEIPKSIEKRKALINMQNKDNQCFKWSIVRALNHVEKNPQCVTKLLRKQSEELNWEGIEFPTPCSERLFEKFEKNNNISLLVFGHVMDSNERITIICSEEET